MLVLKLNHVSKWGRLIFNMGIPIPGKDGRFTETGPWYHTYQCGGDDIQMRSWWHWFASITPAQSRTFYKRRRPVLYRTAKHNKTMHIFNGIYSMSCLRPQMKDFFTLLALCVVNSPVTGEVPSERPSNVDFDVSLMWVRISCRRLLNIHSNGQWFETTWRSCGFIVLT